MKFISPAQIIQTAIAAAINSAFEISVIPNEISLSVCYPKYDAHYTSAIALAIANCLNIEALKIAEAIAQTCSQNPETSSQLQIKAVGKGWLNIFLSQPYMAEKLLALDFWQPEPSDTLINLLSNAPEPILQYAYARCCALIRLAQRENLFTSQSEIMDVEKCSPPTILSFIEPIEISLLLQQFAIAEYLENENKNKNLLVLNRQKLSRSLAEVFLQFYDCCRIFGVSQEIAYRRILLIRITKKLLAAIAPSEINYATYL